MSSRVRESIVLRFCLTCLLEELVWFLLLLLRVCLVSFRIAEVVNLVQKVLL
jgi:hypothetical protein